MVIIGFMIALSSTHFFEMLANPVHLTFIAGKVSQEHLA